MDRDIVDIPEVFRKAFEEDNGWDRGGDGGDDDNGGQGNGGGSSRTWWASRWVWIAILVLTLILSFNWIVTTYTELLWFGAQGFQSVWLTQWVIRVASFLIFFLIAAAVLLINWRIAFKRAKKYFFCMS